MEDENKNKLLKDLLRRWNDDQKTADLLKSIGTKKLLNTSDLLLLCNVSERTVQRWRTDGKIKSIKVGGRYYYYWEDIITIMELKG